MAASEPYCYSCGLSVQLAWPHIGLRYTRLSIKSILGKGDVFDLMVQVGITCMLFAKMPYAQHEAAAP
jgi:hypothetical protein